ncbi:hypothetical protein ABK040_011968 [Willaertia magna]
MSTNNNNEDEFLDVFPPPPPFYRLYHPTKSEFIPPEPPKVLNKDETYVSFGETLTVSSQYKAIRPGFENVKLFFDIPNNDNTPSTTTTTDINNNLNNNNPITLLKKLNRSLIYNFLELLNLLIENPTLQIRETKEISTITNFPTTTDINTLPLKYGWEIKLHHIELILMNMSFLLNYYRPHQAREQMITILKNQFKRRKEITENISDCINNCFKVLKETQSIFLQINKEEENVMKLLNNENSEMMVDDGQQQLKRKREDQVVDGLLSSSSLLSTVAGVTVGNNVNKQQQSLLLKKKKDHMVEVVDIKDDILQRYFQ